MSRHRAAQPLPAEPLRPAAQPSRAPTLVRGRPSRPAVLLWRRLLIFKKLKRLEKQQRDTFA
eukprot:8294425-Pyramimonas_sp.AAC.1